MEDIAVSVIIPVHNGEKYLRQCIESIINQTLWNIEIICIEDASEDNSVLILEEYAQKDTRIRLVYNKKNLGAGVSRNIGIEKARGEYISLLDADDFFDHEFLQEVYQECKRNRLDLCVYDYAKYDDTTKEICKQVNANPGLRKQIGNKVFSMSELSDQLFSVIPAALWTKMIRREFIVENNLKCQDLHNANDVFLSYTLLCNAQRIKYIDLKKDMVFYRVNTGTQLSNNREKSPYCIFEALRAVVKYYIENYAEYMNADFYKWLVGHIMNSINSVSENSRIELMDFYRTKGLKELNIPTAEESGLLTIGHQSYISRLRLENNKNFPEQLFDNKNITDALFKYIGKNVEKCALWGAGDFGRQFLDECEKYQKEISCVIDNDEQKIGKYIKDYPITSLENCYGRIDTILITNNQWFDSIVEQLSETGFNGLVIDLYVMYSFGIKVDECVYRMVNGKIILNSGE